MKSKRLHDLIRCIRFLGLGMAHLLFPCASYEVWKPLNSCFQIPGHYYKHKTNNNRCSLALVGNYCSTNRLYRPLTVNKLSKVIIKHIDSYKT
ncbi:hypothetical protein BK754_28340 [Bacillus thuringiensis serovar subtoxicus]|uniref:Uncharacterized protein n=2 Tax=root TaxID=1 RepID=A0A9X6IIK9_BACTU|nr:hypothetical protein [Bacillus thuringiensis]MBG9670428.1 hypothetical protein [Bacillus thuringiensis]OTY85444.1 hypothetical protein BK754_28340 [Bacillus thuringiensis serovar subtoxicus]OTZ27781.1 hypothetical protein BK763_25145 [Bacillus thuringiensis serovar thompsoni]PNK43696.1 hypothetical protein CBR58_24370 [Bacillus thuringiensis]